MKKNVILLAIFCAFIVLLSGTVTAAEIPSHNNTNLTVANDPGVRFNDNGDNTYSFFLGSGDGTGSIKITNNASNTTPKVIFTNSQSGTFYIMNTGGKGYSDNGLLMLAINGTIPDNFKLHIQASGYQWTPTTGAPDYSNITYNASTLDEIFNKSDFIYGPQNWKPYYINYPIYEGQDLNDLNNNFSIMFIDLYAGILNPKNAKYTGQTLTNNGTIKIQYTIQDLPSFSLAAFNAYAYAQLSGNQPPGVEWTNAVNALGQTSTVTSGYYVNFPPTTMVVNPLSGFKGDNVNLTANLTDTQNNVPVEGKTIQFSVNGTPVGTAVTDVNGIAKLAYKITQNFGKYTILAQFLQDPTYTATNILDVLDKTSPIVISSNPVNNTANIALNTIIKITFNENIKFGTNTWIELYETATGKATSFKSTITGNVLSIIPQSLLASGTKYTVIVHSKSITDLAGNNLTAPYTTRFTTALPPVVTSTNPVNNAVNVAVNKVIQINFNKAIQLGTNPWIELKNQYGQVKPYTTNINGSTLNITSNTTFAKGTTYTVILHSNSVTSTGGAGLAAPYTTKFTTTTA